MTRILPIKYSKEDRTPSDGLYGVKENEQQQTISFWPTGFQGSWPEPWTEGYSKVLYNRQQQYKLIANLANEMLAAKFTSSNTYPIGKNTHWLTLRLYENASKTNLIGIELAIDPSLAIRFKAAESLLDQQKTVGIHLGFVPKHRDEVAARIANNIKLFSPGRISFLNREFTFPQNKNGQPVSNPTRKAITTKVIFPYGDVDPFGDTKDRLAKRFNTIEEEDDKDSSDSTQS